MRWAFLVLAIAIEVVGTLSLKAAAGGATRLYGVVAMAYVGAFGLLSLSLDAGMPLGVAYGIWSAAGVALTATISKLVFKEPLTGIMVAGMGLIIGGVLLVELGSSS
ncbi:MAG: QacE family quaternary ammonium compound efflux transporter [Aeromicrobium sp.]|jgi:small multidrug resistance pump|nr:QacE family quaternary ammonium compound efflux transporter [Aeromicrobium sp.]